MTALGVSPLRVSATAVETRFGIIGGDEHASHGELALALAGEFDQVELSMLEASISDLTRRFTVVRGAEPSRRLSHVADVLSSTLRVTTADPPRLDDLLYHRVATTGVGHELACLLVAVEAGQRAGVDLGIVASARHMVLAVPSMHSPLVSMPARDWRIVDARDLGDPDLSWICPHEAAAIWLAIVRQSAIARGDADVALRSLDLHLSLPLHGPEQQRLRRIRDRIVAPRQGAPA